MPPFDASPASVRPARTAHVELTALTAAERAELEHLLVEFDLRWRAGGFAEAVASLPRARWRGAAIVEMVKIDLEKRWQRGESPALADYRGVVPELAASDD